MKTAPPIRSPTGLGMIWDSACPPSCRAPHDGGRAKIPIFKGIRGNVSEPGKNRKVRGTAAMGVRRRRSGLAPRELEAIAYRMG